MTNTNMCMLNGRFDQNVDNFTSVLVRSSSVVVTHDDLSMFHDFRVTSPFDLITSIPDLPQAAYSGVPDHALLSWKTATDFLQVRNYTDKKSFSANSNDKFDLSKVPGSFMMSNECINFVQMAIDRLEQSQQDQQDIDSVYSTWCHFVRQNMYSSVPYKRVSSGYSTKRHKPGKTVVE